MEETHHCNGALQQKKGEEPGCGRSELPPAALDRDSSQRHVPSRNNRGKVKQIAHHQVRGVAALPDTSNLLGSSNERRSGVVVFVYVSLECYAVFQTLSSCLKCYVVLQTCRPCLGEKLYGSVHTASASFDGGHVSVDGAGVLQLPTLC